MNNVNYACYVCSNKATCKRMVLSNDPYEQCSCDEHKENKTFDTWVWVSTEWKPLSSEEVVYPHINRG